MEKARIRCCRRILNNLNLITHTIYFIISSMSLSKTINTVNKTFILKDFLNTSVATSLYSETIENICKSENFIIQPYFQRNYVWDNEKKSGLIESILIGIPIPCIYVYLDNDTKTEVVIDGQQRLTTIKNFVKNNFPFINNNFEELNNKYFIELPEQLQNKILQSKVNFCCFNNISDKEILFEFFKRYNTGAVHLNHQEIRNCIFSGPYNDLIRELANYEPFSNLFLNNKTDRLEKEEYVLRFLALYQDMKNYNGKMNDFLDTHHQKMMNQSLSKEIQKELKLAFKKAVDANILIFGDDVFKNCILMNTPNVNKTVMYKIISKPVYDMQMLGIVDFGYDLIYRNAHLLKERYEKLLLEDVNIRPHYKKMSKKMLNYRINNWKMNIQEIVEKDY